MILKIIGGALMGFGGLTIISDSLLMPAVNTGSGITQMLGLGIVGLGYWIYSKGDK